MSNIKSIYEFLLWANCSNACKFCWQKHLNQQDKFLNTEQKIHSIQSVKAFLNSGEFVKGSHVLLVGGELFDFDMLPEFESLVGQIIEMMNRGEIELLYLNTNLLYQNLESLYYVLDLIQVNNLFSRLRFTTSFDIVGRFSSEARRDLMLNNMRKIKTKYPEINIVANIILTKQACEKILAEEFSVKGFQDIYQIRVNTIPYIVLTEDMAASKDLIFKTLLFLDKEMPGYLKAYVENFDLPQKKLLYEYTAGNENRLVFCSSDDDAKCGHSINFRKYSIEQDSCFVCDIKKLLEMVEE